MSRMVWRALLITLFLSSFFSLTPAGANPPAPDDVQPSVSIDSKFFGPAHTPKQFPPIGQPNPKEVERLRERQRLLKAGLWEEAQALSTAGSDRVLVILVEFGGTDVFTWNPGDTWDPLGIANPDEVVYDENGDPIIGDCSNIITETRTFTYTGPLNNTIPRPLSEADRSGDSIWTEDFSPKWFDDFMFGEGVIFDYLREDASPVYEDFSGKSVRHYYLDMSGGTYDIEGDVIGWLTLPHSTWWYGADVCPGARSGVRTSSSGAIPGAGSARSLVQDALDAVNAISYTIPGFDWSNYDLDDDGVIDRLWIVHSGYGEEDSTVLLNRTDYGEASIWSHSASLSPYYPVSAVVSAGPYIIMPENGGIGVFAHEYGHNLGAMDLYAYALGETSVGFWSLMADDWTGYPIGFQPPAIDPMHLDMWGWLNPKVIDSTTQVYTVTLGQASEFPGGAGVFRGVKIPLPDGTLPLPVLPDGSFYWWGGKMDLANGMMTTRETLSLPAGASLSFDLAYDIEDEWDFLWVQVSNDDGQTWTTLTNENTICTHDPDWIGGLYGFPDDLCGAGIGGFSGYNLNFPDYENQTMDLVDFAGEDILLRFWYMTDWATTYYGPYVDNIVIAAGSTQVFSDDAETGDAKWEYQEPWIRSDGELIFSHNYYLQWRNVGEDGGYDNALGDPRWRFGPANSGLLVWYNNDFYSDNEIFTYLFDSFGFGPKGKLLVIDSQPDPYRDPYLVGLGYNNEGGNVFHRSLMRDAPFSLNDTVDFVMRPPYVHAETNFEGRGAVSDFHDSMGYYPGAEYVRRGPAYPVEERKWVTVQWDASAVVPATADFGIKAPGYTANEQFRFTCSPYLSGPYTGYLGCYWLGATTGLGYDGGTGNPGDIGAQYGWHVQILEQTESTVTLKIWNAMRAVDHSLKANRSSAGFGDTVTYTYSLTENWGSALDLFACAPLDTARLEYVAGSATNGAVPLTATCADAAAAGSLDSMTASGADNVLSVAREGSVSTGGSAGFAFGVQITAAGEPIIQSVELYEAGEKWAEVEAAPLVSTSPTYLPLIMK